jgi:hypothetical protein
LSGSGTSPAMLTRKSGTSLAALVVTGPARTRPIAAVRKASVGIAVGLGFASAGETSQAATIIAWGPVAAW